MPGIKLSRLLFLAAFVVSAAAAWRFGPAALNLPLSFSVPGPAAPPPADKFIEAPFCSPEVRRFLNIPEEKIDVGAAALVFAKEIYPDLALHVYSARLDALAERVHRLAGSSREPDRRIRSLNTVLLLQEKFQGTRDLNSARRSERYYINRVLDTREGNCVSMPFLYIAVAQRLGWPISLVHVPDHAFVRYVDPALKEQNIETTSRGGYVPDEQYAKDFGVSDRGRASGAYLRTLTRREMLGDLAAINGITFLRRREREKGISYLLLATELNPRNTAAWNNLTRACRRMAGRSTGRSAAHYLEMADAGREKLNELGYVDPKDLPPLIPNRRPI